MFICSLYIIVGLPIAITMSITKIIALILRVNIVHCLWAALFLGSLVFQRRKYPFEIMYNPLDFNRTLIVIIVVLVAIAAFGYICIREVQLKDLFGGRLRWMTIYSLLSISSTLYSSYKAYTIWKSFEIIVVLSVVLIAMDRIKRFEYFKHLLDFHYFLLASLVLTVWGGVVFCREDALLTVSRILPFQIVGVLPAIPANGVGELSAILGIVCLSRALDAQRTVERYFFFWLLMLFVTTLAFAQSRTTIFAFPVASLVLLLFRKKIGLCVFLVFLSALFIFYHYSDVVVPFIMREQSEAQFLDMTGRVSMWSDVWPSFKAAPILGHGFQSGSRFAMMQRTRVDMTTLHGTAQSILLNLGILGFSVFLCGFLAVWQKLLRMCFFDRLIEYKVKDMAIELIGIMIIISFRCTTSSILAYHGLGLMLFLLIITFTDVSEKVQKGSD